MKIIYFYIDEQDKNLFKDSLKDIVSLENVFYSKNENEIFYKACSCEFSYLFVNVINSKENGIKFCRKVRKSCQNIFIIVINNDKELTFESLRSSLNGYILYPFTSKDINFEIDKLEKTIHKNVYIKTFGHFDVFINGDAIHFKNAKSKEFLALLIDKEGSAITMDYAITYLWPHREYDENVKSRYRATLKDLRDTLITNGIYDIITERRNSRSVNRTRFICDYYGLLRGESRYISRFNNDYMFEYSWSEQTATKINDILTKKYKNT